MINVDKIKAKLDKHTIEVFVNTFKAMTIRIFGLIVGLLVSIFLARTLGAEGLGVVNFANKVGVIFLVLTMFGFENVIIKYIAIAKSKFDKISIANTIKTSLFFNLSISIFFATVGAIFLKSIFKFWFLESQELYIPILIILIVLIPQTLSAIYGAALNGYGKIWQSNFLNQNLTILFVGFGLILYFFLEVKFTPITVLILYGVSRILVALIITVFWKNTFRNKTKGQFNFKPMFSLAKPMLLVGGASVIASNVDIIMLGVLGTFEDVGVYSVCLRLAMLTSLFLQVSNAALAPKLASLFHQSRIDEMQLMVSRVTKGLVLVAFFFLLFFFIFGEWFLGLWGAEFKDAYWILIILVSGQVFNISTGCSGVLLNMGGFEKYHGFISLFGLFINIILNVILIFEFGAFGAALATTLTVIVENLSKVILAKLKTGILTIPYR